MAKKKIKVETGFVLFDVVYEDGTRSSRRRVSLSELEDGDAAAKTVIMDQDRQIAEKSGNSRGQIKSLLRSAG